MRFCQPHWNRLKTELETNGLTRMILPSTVVFKQTVDALQGNSTENEPYDPLMAMHNWIVSEFMDSMALSGSNGLYLFTGDYCPLCETDRLNPGRNLPENWIINGTADLAKWMREKGMTDEILNEETFEENR